MCAIKLNGRLVGLRFADSEESRRVSAVIPEPPIENSLLDCPLVRPEPQVEPFEQSEYAVEELLQRVLDSIGEIEQRRNQSLEELQYVAVEIAMRASARMLRQAMEECRLPLEEYVREAITRLDKGGELVIHMHPHDLAVISERNSNHPAGRDVADLRHFVADEQVSRGSLFVDAGDLGLMTSVEQQLMDIRQTLLEGVNDAQVERRRTWQENHELRRFPDRRETA
jgi:hypothetical protein